MGSAWHRRDIHCFAWKVGQSGQVLCNDASGAGAGSAMGKKHLAHHAACMEEVQCVVQILEAHVS